MILLKLNFIWLSIFYIQWIINHLHHNRIDPTYLILLDSTKDNYCLDIIRILHHHSHNNLCSNYLCRNNCNCRTKLKYIYIRVIVIILIIVIIHVITITIVVIIVIMIVILVIIRTNILFMVVIGYSLFTIKIRLIILNLLEKIFFKSFFKVSLMFLFLTSSLLLSFSQLILFLLIFSLILENAFLLILCMTFFRGVHLRVSH